MPPIAICPIVEGQGDEQAVPALLHRLRAVLAPECELRVLTPIRVKATSFINDVGYAKRYLTLAAEKARAQGGVVWIFLDCDGQGDAGCAARLGPRLRERAVGLRADVAFDVILAVREFESWLIASIESMAGAPDVIADALMVPADPEAIRDGKGWLSRCMARRYDPIEHQRAFTARLDPDRARRAPSFARLLRKFEGLVATP